jgi:ribonuclease G
MLRELFVSRLGGQLWSALREDGSTVELRVERAHGEAPAGRIIKARVTNILPGIQSAFLDIGTERGAFLHVKDLVLPGGSVNGSAGIEGEGDELEDLAADVAGSVSPDAAAPIEQRLSVGRELLVQVSREPMGTKGAKVSGFLSIPGRLVVLLPSARARGVSRRIGDAAERERLKGILDRLPGEEVGFVARTAAEGAAEADLQADAASLMRTWCEIQDRAAALPAPSVIHRDHGLLLRLLRETPRDGLERIVLDDEEDRAQALRYLQETDPPLATRLELHTGRTPLFESRGLHLDVEKALRPRVWLRSGGYLVIQETEALVSIDVNTGKFVGKRDLEQTALRANLEAAKEIARQLRLRDLGGIIVIDFIDVLAPESRNAIVDALKRRLRTDPARTKIIGLSELGLLQLTRKRTRPAVGTQLTRSCPLCTGLGRIKSAWTVAAEVVSALRRRAAADAEDRLNVKVHPETAPAVLAALAQSEFSSRGGAALSVEVETDRSMRPDRFEIRARLD